VGTFIFCLQLISQPCDKWLILRSTRYSARDGDLTDRMSYFCETSALPRTSLWHPYRLPVLLCVKLYSQINLFHTQFKLWQEIFSVKKIWYTNTEEGNGAAMYDPNWRFITSDCVHVWGVGWGDQTREYEVNVTSLCLTEHHAIKAYWGSGGIAPRILRHWH
jgi:hypothetical protein